MIRNFYLVFLLLLSVLSEAQDFSSAPKPFREGGIYVKGSAQTFRRLAAMDPELRGSQMESLAKDFRSGQDWSFDIGLRVGSHQYVGLTRSEITQNGTARISAPSSLGTIWSEGRFRERMAYTGINYNYLVPFGNRERFFFTTKAGMGIWNYSTVANAWGMEERMQNTGVGYQLGTGLEVRITQVLGFAADLELLSGGVELEGGQRENLSQLRAGTGLVLRF